MRALFPSLSIAGCCCAVALASCARSSRVDISAPRDSYLLAISQHWGASSALGDLRTRRMAPQDLEVRLWSGYGLVGSSAIILRREGKRWRAWSADIEHCMLWIPTAMGDTLSKGSYARLNAETRRFCNDSTKRYESGSSHVLIRVDTVALIPMLAAHDYAALWRDLVEAGILTLPPMVPRKWLMMDGHTYVLEVRQGPQYRASVIEQASETDADYRIQQIYALVAERLRSSR